MAKSGLSVAADTPEPANQEITTLLGRGSTFEGKLTFEGAVRIDGKFSGEIFSEGTLIIGKGAEVEADLEVRAVVIQGVVAGDVRAANSIEIHAPARVSGSLTTPQLFIDKGATFDGQCQMTSPAAAETERSEKKKKSSGGEKGGEKKDGAA